MNSPEIRLLAQQLLLIHQGQSELVASVPAAEELAALLDGRLSFARRQEVYAYLNRSPQLFSQWIALVEAVSNQQVEQQNDVTVSGMNVWRRLVDYWSGGAARVWYSRIAAVLVIAVVLPVVVDTWLDSHSKPMAIGREPAVPQERQLNDILTAQVAACSSAQAPAVGVADLYQSLTDIRTQYGQNGINSPAKLRGMTEEDLAGPVAACDFIEVLLDDLNK